MSKTVAVLGLGRFGRKCAETLYEMGADIIVADHSETAVESLSDKAAYAMVADLTVAESIYKLGLEGVDVMVVAMGSNLTASIMSVMVGKELGVPHVIAKAGNARMGDILKRVGADEVIHPEEESGRRMARTIMSESILDLFDLGKDLQIVEMAPKPEWVGKSISELRLRDTYGVSVVALKDPEGRYSMVDTRTPIKEDCMMLLIAERDDPALG